MRVAILGLLALIVGGATIFFAKGWLATERANNAQTSAPVPTTQVLVATINMPTSHFVKPEDLKWQPWPEDSVLESYIVREEGVPQDFAGTVAASIRI